jgi:hypothetical protein
MPKTTHKNNDPDKLEQAKNEFKKWRESRKNPKSLIPEPLLAIAAELTKNLGVCRTAQALGLNHTRLKNYLAKTSQSQIKQTPIPQSFMQLNFPNQINTNTPVYEIETENPTGRKICLRFYQPPSTADLKNILSLFD